MSPTSHDQPAPASAVDDLASRWFPLIPRVKPICRPLPDRVARVRHLAHLARQPPGGSLTRAAEAHNLAALIASDCGLPDLARSLCWRQFDTFCQAGPFEAETGKLALQPLVNLGRLHIRDGEGSSAYQLLEALFTAVKSRDQTVIEDRTVDLRSVIVDVREHRDVVRWLWSVLLADGTRALARAGRWAQALHHAQQHKGIGQRLLDGRQVAILAAHDRDAALGLLAATRTPTPWEKAVAACLEVLCRASAGRETTTAVATMVNRYVALEPGPAQAAFHARLGLCAIGLAHSAGQAESSTRQ
jgi:hypothetical protein